MGIVFSHVKTCLSVFLSMCVCLSLCLGYNFWIPPRRYILPYLGHVWVSRSRSGVKKKIFLCIWLQNINKIKVKSRSFLRRGTLTRVVYIWVKCVLVPWNFWMENITLLASVDWIHPLCKHLKMTLSMPNTCSGTTHNQIQLCMYWWCWG